MKRNIFILAVLMITALFTGCLTTAPVSGTKTVSSDAVPGEGFILDKKVVYEYNSDGLKIKKYDYDKKNQIKETVEYLYENNILTGKKFYDKNNNYDSYENYKYDSEDRKIRETEYKPDGSVKNYKIYEYTENNSYTKKYFKDSGNLYRYVVRKYNRNGQLLEESDWILEF